MKKSLFTIIPLLAVLVSGIAFNVYEHLKSKTEYVCVSKTLFGYNIDSNVYDNQGSNYFVYVLRNNKDGATIGNVQWGKGYCTWYMNR